MYHIYQIKSKNTTFEAYLSSTLNPIIWKLCLGFLWECANESDSIILIHMIFTYVVFNVILSEFQKAFRVKGLI